jgi:hypothetical protein
MNTIPFGGTIHRELLSLAEAVGQEVGDRPGGAVEFSRLLAEKSGVFRLWLKTYLGLFTLLEQLEDRWRLGVFRGEAGFDPGQEADIHGLFEIWSRLSDPMRQRMEFYARHALDIRSEAEELARCTQKVRHILTSWQPPTLAKSKALRIRYVTPEEATGLGLPAE